MLEARNEPGQEKNRELTSIDGSYKCNLAFVIFLFLSISFTTMFALIWEIVSENIASVVML